MRRPSSDTSQLEVERAGSRLQVPFSSAFALAVVAAVVAMGWWRARVVVGGWCPSAVPREIRQVVPKQPDVYDDDQEADHLRQLMALATN